MQPKTLVYVWRTPAKPNQQKPASTWRAPLCTEHAAAVFSSEEGIKVLAVFAPDSQSYESECTFDTRERLGMQRSPGPTETVTDVVGQRSILWERYYFNVIPREARVHAAQEAH